MLSKASPTAQDQDQLAAAAPCQPLPGLGLALAGDLEPATGTLETPAEFQQIPFDHPLLSATKMRLAYPKADRVAGFLRDVSCSRSFRMA